MLKFQEIISGLTNEQKIDILCSTDGNIKKIEESGFSKLSFVDEKVSTNGSLYQAAISFNDSIIESYIENLYKNSKDTHLGNIDKKKYDKLDTISESRFLNEHFLNLYNNTLRRISVKNALVIPSTENDIDRSSFLKSYYKIIRESNPDFLITENYLDKTKLSTLRFTNNLVIKSNDIVNIIRSFNNGYICAITDLKTKNLLLEAIDKFELKKEELLAGKINEIELKRLEGAGEILNPNNLDKALDNRLDIMYQDRYQKETKDNSFTSYDELTIMYKNDGLLPLKKDDKVCLVGAFARENFANIDIVEEANKYNLKATNYTHGYLYNNQELGEPVIEDAIEKSADSIALVYLGTNELCYKELPDNQIELIKRLHEAGRKVITVIYSYQYFDKRVLDYSNAILVYADINAMSDNIFDLIYGKKNPSGKTLWYTPISDDVVVNPKDKQTYLFPIGYGLNYGRLKVTEYAIGDGLVNFGVSNDSKYDSKFTILLFENRDDLDKRIIGYSKFFLKANEKARISIPISDESFIEYNYEKHIFEIHGGIYTLSLYNDGEELASTSVILNPHEFENGIGTVSTEGKADILAKSVDKMPHADLLRKKRFIITSIFFLYAMVVCIVLAFIFKRRNVNWGFNASLVALISFFVIYFLHFIYYMVKKPKKLVEKTYESLIKEMDIVNKDVEIIYPKPIKEEIKEEVIEPLDEKVEYELNDQVDDYEDTLVEENLSEDDKAEETINDVTLAKRTINPENVANGCIEYLASKGISVTTKPLNQIFSSIPATKIIYLKSNDQSKLDKFVEGVQEYIDTKPISIDLNNINSFNELLVDEESDVSKLMIDAAINRDKVYFLYVKNSTNETFKKALLPFINKNVNKTNVYVIIADRKIQISNNIYLLIDASNLDNNTDGMVEIDCNIAEINKTEFNGEIEGLNIDSLLNILKINQENIYIQEEDFKKFDDLFDEINDPHYKTLTNRMTVDFDKIYPMLLVTGMEKSDVIDLILRMCVVPLLKKTKLYKENKSELIKIVSRIFNQDLIPVSLKALNENKEVSHE